ncbi:cobalamin biosynthesis protein CbiX [Microbacterium caowuchunii]|uniref:Cobalamin biosynthesis protein CbiX n=1 Tax=Microbacterium caowuchunii TaxID=2614638 RepID=A0A5N0T753_9MICO|nr:cobalamin biosynthesis protein CbiX [Microbacterium caowuchunii]KAA9129957.1 cobalamin biosynthesis protein CbiX [Microbacterium caowuchunii]
MTPGSVRTVLVGGHESADGEDLTRFAGLLDAPAQVSAAGRTLDRAVSDALAAGETVVVVPMTFGRNPTMVADAAKTLRWLAAKNPGRLALTAPFGQPDHLTAWLRTAANRARASDSGDALLIVAPRSNPFDEAELHRLAYLVAANGALPEVHVAIADDAEEVDRAADRVRRVAPGRVVAVPAGFAAHLPGADVEQVAPLMSDAAVIRVIRSRVREALAALAAGDDGIDTGLAADHGHGYAHSHTFEATAGHHHPHGGAAPHMHADGTVHAHGHGEARLVAAGREPVTAASHEPHI